MRVPSGRLTFALCAFTAVGLVAQLVFPRLPPLFERNAAEVWNGEWWRLVTALFFQDGGVVGGLSNIAALLFVGGLAEQVFGPLEWVAIYGVGAVAAGIAGLWWQPVGAGNSIAICSLAGALSAAWPFERHKTLSAVWRALTALGGGFLLARRDIHGVAFVVGAVLYVAIP